MTCRTRITGLFVLSALCSAAQNENGVWLFNNTMGVDFMTTPPDILTNYPGFWGNTAVICDGNGDLMLYSDDTRILNGQDQVLVNGDGLFNSIYTNTTQSSMILPWPGHPGSYYMIQPYPWNLNDPVAHTYYHRIDMNAGGGIGQVMEKNIILADSTGAYMTAVLDSAGTGIWVILHHLNAPRFMAYHLDDSGLSTTPMITGIGIPVESTSPYQAIGMIRPSPHGERLYLNKLYNNVLNNALIHQMDFNRTTGEVSNHITFEGPTSGYHGMEISPSGQFLYYVTYVCDSGIASRLWQYDISSGDSATMHDSRALVYEAPITPGGCMGKIGNLALAVDGRIYCAVSNAQFLGVINHPDLPAPACEYLHHGLYLDGDTSWMWLPNQMREYPIGIPDVVGDHKGPATLRIRPNPSRDGCRITLPGTGIRHLSIVDATGRLVREIPCVAGQGEVRMDRGDLRGGIYRVVARNGDGCVEAAGRVVFE